jgi:nucleoside-diphosphate-sugar epimerase
MLKPLLMDMDTNKQKNVVLVTGGTGFIGRHVCACLHDLGYMVRVAVRHRTELPSAWQQVIVGEIDASTHWDAAVEGVHGVVHLVSYSPAPQSSASEQAAAYHRINVDGSAALARAAAAAGVRRFIYLSTIKVNGEMTTADRPYTFESPPRPEDAYGRSKWQAEQLLQAIAGDGSLELLILRPPLVYGPGVRGNFLALLRLVERGLPLPLRCVRNRRSLLYVKNLADAVGHALASPRWTAQTYLLSDGEDLSTPELIRRIAAQMARPARLWPVPVPVLRAALNLSGRHGMVERLTGSLAVDTAPFRDHFGWSPPYDVDTGLRDTVVWYRAQQARVP